MTISRLVAAAAAASIVLGLAACGSEAPVIAPTVVEVADLQGDRVEVPLNGKVVLLTGDLDVTSYTAEIADPAIAEFVRGADTGDAAYSPGLTPLKVGETEVTLSNEDGGIEDVTFTLAVEPVAGTAGIGGAGR